MKTLPLLLPLCLLLAACKPPGDGPAPADAPQVEADAPAVPAAPVLVTGTFGPTGSRRCGAASG